MKLQVVHQSRKGSIEHDTGQWQHRATTRRSCQAAQHPTISNVGKCSSMSSFPHQLPHITLAAPSSQHACKESQNTQETNPGTHIQVHRSQPVLHGRERQRAPRTRPHPIPLRPLCPLLPLRQRPLGAVQRRQRTQALPHLLHTPHAMCELSSCGNQARTSV